MLFNNKFDFDENVTSLCRKACKKLNALAKLFIIYELSTT